MRLEPRELLSSFVVGRSVYLSSFPLEMVTLSSLHFFTPRLHEFSARMVPVKGTPTLKWELGVRHSVLLILDDDISDSWNLCLFIWLSWVLCYWVGLGIWIMIKSVLRIQCLENPRVPPRGSSTEGKSGPKIRPKGVVDDSVWSLISLTNPLFRRNGFGFSISLDRVPDLQVSYRPDRYNIHINPC